MSNLDTVSTFDNPKSKLDVLDAWDVVDDIKRYDDKLQETIKKQQEQLNHDTELIRAKNSLIRELTQKVVTLETKIKMLERGQINE
jgi:hypothetical protein